MPDRIVEESISQTRPKLYIADAGSLGVSGCGEAVTSPQSGIALLLSRERTMTTQRITRHDRVLQPQYALAACEGAPLALRAHARPSPTPHLTADQYVSLLAVIDDAGVATIDGISRALPEVPHPVSAVFDLCDGGILNVDWEAAFDGDMHVWRIDL